ncbi:cobQ/CobB/MinD/ParA nucleotide binding domain protein [Mycobacterium kansasii]|uniref:CobQ/CobB/MinD/ParA nucleotide binding domain protein n=1 Tax=Mycobacterium kansasii TaxID=1768 RepID=A0A1V3WF79_MYCKA|nr:cobQ/CobB/MinD/ParA nucleotide binding domain protein [Mycobacterium kansasii]
MTTAIQLAGSGLRVRVIDLDPQANASTWLGYPDIGGITIADVLRQQATIDDIERPARIIQGFTDAGEPEYSGDDAAEMHIGNLTVVPAARSTLDKLMVELPAVTGGVMRLRDALEAATPVDVTLIDSPGSNSALVTTALIASSVDEDAPAGGWGLITCTKPAGKESEGIQALLHELAIIKKTFRIDIPLLAIVPCAVPGTGSVYREQMEYLQEGFGDKVTPAVRRSSIVDEAYTNYLPVPLYGYRAKDVSKDYENVIDHMKRHGMFRPAAIKA